MRSRAASSERPSRFLIRSSRTSSGAVTAAQVEAAFQPDHFYLTEEGFTFWFQPGELSGVSGNSPIETVVPYSVFEELLQAWIV